MSCLEVKLRMCVQREHTCMCLCYSKRSGWYWEKGWHSTLDISETTLRLMCLLYLCRKSGAGVVMSHPNFCVLQHKNPFFVTGFSKKPANPGRFWWGTVSGLWIQETAGAWPSHDSTLWGHIPTWKTPVQNKEKNECQSHAMFWAHF